MFDLLLASSDAGANGDGGTFIFKESFGNGWPPSIDAFGASLRVVQGGANQVNQSLFNSFDFGRSQKVSSQLGYAFGASLAVVLSAGQGQNSNESDEEFHVDQG